jgi:PHD finger-like domain-containing protein 5A
MAARHHPDLVMCRKLPGIVVGKLCERCDGRCVLCDSYVRPTAAVRICDECNFGAQRDRCVVCGGPGSTEAFYCHACCLQEKDRDGCPKIVNIGSARMDMFYERKKYSTQSRR